MIYTLPLRLENGQVFTSLPTQSVNFSKLSLRYIQALFLQNH